MKVGAYSTLIVAVILGVVLTTSLMVPVIANVDAGQTEERLVPTDVTNGELFDSRHNAPDGQYYIGFDHGTTFNTPGIQIDYDRLYVDSTYTEGHYNIEGTITEESGDYIIELYSTGGGIDKIERYAYRCPNDVASEYGISNVGWCSIMCYMSVADYGVGTMQVRMYIGNSGNEEDRPNASITLIPKGVVAYMGKPDITTNGYLASQVMLGSGLTTNATTEAYYVTSMTPTGARVVDRVTHNNTLVGYLNNDESQPVYKFNVNNDIDLFAPIDNTFLGVETIDYTDYYSVKDITIYEKKTVPVDSPIKWVLAIIPVMVLVGIVVTVIQTQITQKRD